MKYIDAYEAVRALAALPAGTVGVGYFGGRRAAFVRTADDAYITEEPQHTTEELLRGDEGTGSFLDARGAADVSLLAPGERPVLLALAAPDRATHSPATKGRIAAAMDTAPVGTTIAIGELANPRHSAALDLWHRLSEGWACLPCGPQYDFNDLDDPEALSYLIEDLDVPVPANTHVLATGSTAGALVEDAFTGSGVVAADADGMFAIAEPSSSETERGDQ